MAKWHDKVLEVNGNETLFVYSVKYRASDKNLESLKNK